MSVEFGEYGPVLVLEGEYKGRVGYYDDDCDLCDGYDCPKGVDTSTLDPNDDDFDAKIAELCKDCPPCGYVYMDKPFGDELVVIRLQDLDKYDGPLLSVEKYCRDHPVVAAQLGVVR